MDKTTAGLLGVAAAGLATMGSAQAASAPVNDPSEVLRASSYADLLSPVQDAVAVMKADDDARARASDVELPSGVQLADGYFPNFGPVYHHHHHHHHHHHQVYYHHHHHHHHHHQQAVIGVPGIGGVVIGR